MFDEIFSVRNLTELVVKYRKDEELDQLDDVHELIKSINVECGELLQEITFKKEIHDSSICYELADVFIYCIALANYLNCEISSLVNDKINFNKQRNRKYPKN